MSVHFNTGPYYFSHGCAPRGYGMWGFYFDGGEPWFTTGSYAYAKKAATAEAKRRGCRVVAVAP